MDCLSDCDRFKISVLSALRVRPDISVSLPYSRKILLKDELEFSEMMAMSSAYARDLILQDSENESGGMFLFISMLRIRGSIAMIKRVQLKASPCLTPLRTGKTLDLNPLI